MISDVTQTVGVSITCLVTFWLAPNSWSLTWSLTTFLSTVITTFLEYTWHVGSNNKMSMISPSICFDYLLGQIERKNMLILFLGTTRKHRISPMTENVARKWLTKSWLHTMSPSMWWSHQLFVTLIIPVELVTLTWFRFNPNLSWLCQWRFAKLITAKKVVT